MSFLRKLFGRRSWERALEEEEDFLPEGAGDQFAPASWTGSQPAGASYVSETVLDVVDPTDMTVPEELRGCRVVQRVFPDGTSRIFYVGESGFCADEEQVDVLVRAYRQGGMPQATGGLAQASIPRVAGGVVGPGQAGAASTGVAPAVAPGGAPAGPSVLPGPGTGFGASAGGAQGVGPGAIPVGSVAVSGAARASGGPVVPQSAPGPAAGVGPASATDTGDQTPSQGLQDLSVLAELPSDESVPPLLREALLVRRGGVELYLTMDGREIPAEEGDRMIAQWQSEQAAPLTPAHPPAAASLPESEPTLVQEGPGVWERAHEEDSGVGPSPDVTPQVLRSPAAAGDEAPDTRPGSKELVLTREPDPWERALASAGLEGLDEPGPASAPLEETGASAGPSRDKGPAFRKVMKVAEALRNRVLQGEWEPPQLEEESIRSACEEAILGVHPDDRMERAARESLGVLRVLSGEVATALDRTLRKDLEAGAKLLLVIHPARLGDLDLGVLSALIRLRFSEAKRNAVIRDLTALYHTVVVRDVTNYLMTRNFLDELAARLEEDGQVVSGKVLKLSGLRRLLMDLLSRRASLGLDEVLEHVGRRHMVDLSFMRPELLTALEPVLRAVVDALVHELRAAGRRGSKR